MHRFMIPFLLLACLAVGVGEVTTAVRAQPDTRHPLTATDQTQFLIVPTAPITDRQLLELLHQHNLTIFDPIEYEGRTDLLAVQGTWSTIDALYQTGHLAWYEPYKGTPDPMVDSATELVYADDVQALGYTGAGVTVGVWDQVKLYPHLDFASRLTDTFPHAIPITYHWHSPQVTGILAGSGEASQANGGEPYQWQGFAPESQVVFSLASPSGLAQKRTEYGVTIANNSWGYLQCHNIGTYDLDSAYYDQAIHQLQDVSVVFAAGNLANCNPNGYGTLSKAGPVAKNVLTVGSIGRESQVSSFSSHGPTADGRIKPDLMALGENVRSTALWDGYGGMNGTSASAPAVSGVLALLSEAYQQQHNQLPASDYLKAILLHSAIDLGQTGPDYAYGWGKLNASGALQLILGQTDAIVYTGTINSLFTLDLPASSALKATLYWHDPAGEMSQPTALVHDLNLTAVSPDGTTHQPYLLDPANPHLPAQTGVDTLNNVEQVEIPANISAGEWLFSVADVPDGQPFVLVISYEAEPTAVSLQTATSQPSQSWIPFIFMVGLLALLSLGVYWQREEAMALQLLWWVKRADPTTHNLLLALRVQAVKVFLPISVGLIALYGALNGWLWLWVVVFWELYECINGVRYLRSLPAYADEILLAEARIWGKRMLYVVHGCLSVQFMTFWLQIDLTVWVMLVVYAFGIGAAVAHLATSSVRPRS